MVIIKIYSNSVYRDESIAPSLDSYGLTVSEILDNERVRFA